MKQSPLNLKWISYPAASYEDLDGFNVEMDKDPCPIKIGADVTWDIDGEHTASLLIQSEEGGGNVPYRFVVSVASIFTFDLEVAIKAYRPSSPIDLPAILAVNVARILFSGAREQLAMMTARAPYGAAQLPSVLLEPSDIKIASTVEPPKILREIFKVPDDVISKIEKQAVELAGQGGQTATSTDA